MQQPQPHLLRIGDFSRLAQISISALRHYDELGLLKPAQVDRFTDYRYYALEQLPRLNRILALKDLGLSLDQIKQLLDRTIDRGVPPQTLREMLAAKQAEIAVQLREEQARLGRVEARLRQIEHEDDPPVKFDVVLKPMAAQTVISTRFVVPHLSQMEEHRQLAMRLEG